MVCAGESPKTEPGLYSISTIVDEFALEDRTVQEYKPGESVPPSGISIIKRDPLHADMPYVVTMIKGGRFATCRHCTASRSRSRMRRSMSPRSIVSTWHMHPSSNRFSFPAWRG